MGAGNTALTFNVLFCDVFEEVRKEVNIILDQPLPTDGWFSIATTLKIGDVTLLQGQNRHVYQDTFSWFNNAVTLGIPV